MDKPTIALALIFTTLAPLHAQTLQEGEARLPLKQLQQLMEQARPQPVIPPTPAPPPPPPVLLSSRFLISHSDSRTQVVAKFRVMSYSDDLASTPIFDGDLSLVEASPETTLLTRRSNQTSLTTDHKGMHDVTLQMTPSMQESHTLQVPDCAARLLECGTLPENQALELTFGQDSRLLHTGDLVALPMGDAPVLWKIITPKAADAPLPPPEPSTWTWQHQVLALPENNALSYYCSSQASAQSGDGVNAQLILPRGCYDIEVDGPDLDKQTIRMNEQGSPVLQLEWKTRGVIQRRIDIQYQLPASPLDPDWTLQTPDGQTTRLLLADHAQLNYESKQLRPPVPSNGLPPEWMDALDGKPVHPLDTASPATIHISRKPVAETATGMIPQADWELQIEPDGSMIATGTLVVSHKAPYDITWETPKDMQLLSCELDGTDHPPTQLNDNRMSLNLAGSSESTKVKISFTGRTAVLNPLEGTLTLALPTVRSFIAKLDWRIKLPEGYQAETAGNLTRIPTKATPSMLNLHKNLCRDESPEVQLFYQRTQAAQ
jgi:hypothetical protein